MSRWLRQIRLAVRTLFRKPQVDRELDEEFQYHLERQIEENLHRGLALEPAPALRSDPDRRVTWVGELERTCQSPIPANALAPGPDPLPIRRRRAHWPDGGPGRSRG